MNRSKPKILFFSILMALPSQIEAQFESKALVKDTVEVNKTSSWGFSKIYQESNSNSIQLKFETITKKQFLDYKLLNYSSLDTNTKGIRIDENSFQLIAADTNFIFRCEDYYYCPHYHGYYPGIDSYLIGISGNEVYDTYLIERSTSNILALLEFYDVGNLDPIISPNGNYMLFSGTCQYCDDLDDYGSLSTLDFVDISQLNQLEDLRQIPTKEFSTKDWLIEEILWIDNSHIALKVHFGVRIKNETPNEQYYITEINF